MEKNNRLLIAIASKQKVRDKFRHQSCASDIVATGETGCAVNFRFTLDLAQPVALFPLGSSNNSELSLAHLKSTECSGVYVAGPGLCQLSEPCSHQLIANNYALDQAATLTETDSSFFSNASQRCHILGQTSTLVQSSYREQQHLTAAAQIH